MSRTTQDNVALARAVMGTIEPINTPKTGGQLARGAISASTVEPEVRNLFGGAENCLGELADVFSFMDDDEDVKGGHDADYALAEYDDLLNADDDNADDDNIDDDNADDDNADDDNAGSDVADVDDIALYASVMGGADDSDNDNNIDAISLFPEEFSVSHSSIDGGADNDGIDNNDDSGADVPTLMQMHEDDYTNARYIDSAPPDSGDVSDVDDDDAI